MSKHKSKKKASQKKKSQVIEKTDNTNYLFIPIIIILTIIPLIVRMVMVSVDSISAIQRWNPNYADLFSKGKSNALIVFCIFLFIIFFTIKKETLLKKTKQLSPYLILISIFILFTFLSSIFSNQKDVSFLGLFDRSEGFITVFCYMILFIYTVYTYKSTHDFKLIVISLFIIVAVNSFIGAFQYFGHDLLNTSFGKALVIPRDYQNNINPANNSKYLIYGTFYHYNYMGSFAAMTVPLLLVTTLFTKKISNKLIAGAFTLLSFWLLFGSTSRAGVVGVIGALIFAIIFFGKIIFKHWKMMLAFIGALIILMVSLNSVTNNKIFKRLPSLKNDALSIFDNSSDINYIDNLMIKDIQNINGDVVIKTSDNLIKVSKKSANLVFTDNNNDVIDYQQNNTTFSTTDPRFSNFKFNVLSLFSDSTYQDGMTLIINDGIRKTNYSFMFKISPENEINLTTDCGAENISLDFPDTFGFKGKEKLGSMRGYIWSRSIPLIKDNLILGYGPDTFVFNFPQNDLLGKYYAYGTSNIIVDKPHNLYLQIFLNYGGIAFLSFIIFILIYIINCIKLYSLKKQYNKNQMVGISICLGIIGYLFAGLFNDSIVSVAPIFWILLGCGVAVNHINKTEKG